MKTCLYKMLVIVWAAVHLAACGNSDNATSPETNNNSEANPLDQQLVSVASKANLSCDSSQGNDCPASMAIAFTRTLNQNALGPVSACNAVFIEDNIVLIPSVCFSPSSTLTPDQVCQRYLILKTKHSNETYRCESVLTVRRGVSAADDPGLWREDFVAFKTTLPNSSVTPISISSSGVNLQESIGVWSYRDFGNFNYRAEKSSCFVWGNNFVTPGNLTPFSSILPIDDCGQKVKRLLPGALAWSDEHQELLATFALPLPTQWMEDWKPYLAAGQSFPSMGFLVNAHCLPILNSSQNPGHCLYNRMDKDMLLRKRHQLLGEADNVEQVTQQASEEFDKGDQYLKFTPAPGDNMSDLVRKVRMVPKCFQNSSQWLPGMRAGFFRVYKSSHRVDETWPQWLIDFQLFDHLVVKGSLRKEGTRPLIYEFAPCDLHKKKRSHVKIFDPTGSWVEREYSDIPLCP